MSWWDSFKDHIAENIERTTDGRNPMIGPPLGYSIAKMICETIQDGKNTEEYSRQCRLKAKVHADKTRMELLEIAHTLWLKRNDTLKEQLIIESEFLLEINLTLLQFNGIRTRAVTDFGQNETSDSESLKEKSARVFSCETSINDALEYSKDQFPYDKYIFYIGTQDEFIKYLDGFIRAELKENVGLMKMWDKAHKSVLKIDISWSDRISTAD